MVYNGIIDCLTQTIKSEGIRAMYVRLCVFAEGKGRFVVSLQPLSHLSFVHTPNQRTPNRYKGIGPTFLSGVPYVGLQMTAYELCKRLLPHPKPAAPGQAQVVGAFEGTGWLVFWKLTAGALSGVIAQTITYPGDTVRRMSLLSFIPFDCVVTCVFAHVCRAYANQWVGRSVACVRQQLGCAAQNPQARRTQRYVLCVGGMEQAVSPAFCCGWV